MKMRFTVLIAQLLWAVSGHAVSATISGVKWNDLNANGSRDQGEPVLEGVTIYIDLNTNGQFEQGEPFAQTLGDGAFELLDVAIGNYPIRVFVPAGFAHTFPLEVFHSVDLPAGRPSMAWTSGTASATRRFTWMASRGSNPTSIHRFRFAFHVDETLLHGATRTLRKFVIASGFLDSDHFLNLVLVISLIPLPDSLFSKKERVNNQSDYFLPGSGGVPLRDAAFHHR